MTEEEQKPLHPGAYNSCLIPYAEQIFSWWYDDQLSIAEIKRRLDLLGLQVNPTTISRFIKVREKRDLRRIRPAHLIPDKTIRKTLQSPQKSSQSTEFFDKKDYLSPKEESVLPSAKDIEEAEAMIQKLLNSTPQQLGLEEEEAMMRMKKK